jgi:hypothetical protein
MRPIRRIRRLEETTLRLGGVGDNWHMTWAADDKQYVSLCDGTGWPGMPQASYNSRAYAIAGAPPEPTFEYLPGYPSLVNQWGTRECSRYYNFGILALDGRIYQFLSTPNHPFHEPEPRFVGAKLILSPDHGRTWCNQDGSSPYEQNTDGCVYVYAPNGNTEGTMNQLVMFRVPKGRILERRAYEFFVRRRPDGEADWSGRIADRGVVHTFPSGWVNRHVHPYAWHPSVVYVAPLGLYLMANWGMGCGPGGGWFGKPSYLGFWTAPQPWGPWTQVHEETAWTPAADRGARAYQPQIAPKWIAGDGGSFWLVWTDFQDVEGRGKPYYSFNAQQVEVVAE